MVNGEHGEWWKTNGGVTSRNSNSNSTQILILHIYVAEQNDPNGLHLVVLWWKISPEVWPYNTASVVDYLYFQQTNLKD